MPPSEASPGFGNLLLRAHCRRNNNQILHGDQTIFEENFTGSTTTAMTRDLFATAKDSCTRSYTAGRNLHIVETRLLALPLAEVHS